MGILPAIFLFIISLLGMFLFLVLEPVIGQSIGIPLVVFWTAMIIIFSWVGLFERSITSYAVFSTLIQVSYFALDVSSAVAAGKSMWFALIQLLNFAIAGGLFMLVIALLYKKINKDLLVEYSGLYEKNKFIVFMLALSCLSLGGMAGFNIFVGEFLLYSFLFTMHPALTIFAIFAGLVAFMFYFRICYILLVRKSEVKIPIPLPLKMAIASLGILVVGLGVVPHILLGILEMVT